VTTLIKNIANNKKARHEFELLDKFEAGLCLLGSEVKSLRQGNGTIKEAWVRFENREAWLVGANFKPYEYATHVNHEPMRPRKLLLNKKEIKKLRAGTREKGLTIVPLTLFFKGPYVKLEIALARGKNIHDKRQSLKQKQAKRDISDRRR
jgi:SsrA-binding protein